MTKITLECTTNLRSSPQNCSVIFTFFPSKTFFSLNIFHTSSFTASRNSCHCPKTDQQKLNPEYLLPGPNFIELLKHKIIAKENEIMLTRIGIPPKITCHMFNSAHFCQAYKNQAIFFGLQLYKNIGLKPVVQCKFQALKRHQCNGSVDLFEKYFVASSGRRSEHTVRNVELKPVVLFRTTQTH